MSKHTPGPWFTYDKAAYGIGITKGSAAGQYIASVQQYVGLNRAETVANARLIAAAPEMLEALALARRAFNTISSSNGATREAQAAIKAAIAKATGGEP